MCQPNWATNNRVLHPRSVILGIQIFTIPCVSTHCISWVWHQPFSCLYYSILPPWRPRAYNYHPSFASGDWITVDTANKRRNRGRKMMLSVILDVLSRDVIFWPMNSCIHYAVSLDASAFVIATDDGPLSTRACCHRYEPTFT